MKETNCTVCERKILYSGKMPTYCSPKCWQAHNGTKGEIREAIDLAKPKAKGERVRQPSRSRLARDERNLIERIAKAVAPSLTERAERQRAREAAAAERRARREEIKKQRKAARAALYAERVAERIAKSTAARIQRAEERQAKRQTRREQDKEQRKTARAQRDEEFLEALAEAGSRKELARRQRVSYATICRRYIMAKQRQEQRAIEKGVMSYE